MRIPTPSLRCIVLLDIPRHRSLHCRHLQDDQGHSETPASLDLKRDKGQAPRPPFPIAKLTTTPLTIHHSPWPSNLVHMHILVAEHTARCVCRADMLSLQREVLLQHLMATTTIRLYANWLESVLWRTSVIALRQRDVLFSASGLTSAAAQAT